MCEPAASPLLVDYLVLAEFDIDRGSLLRVQYPRPVEICEEQFIAEQMLPDGAHNREEDWTIFFLSKTTTSPPNPDEPDTTDHHHDRISHASGSGDGNIGGTIHGPPSSSVIESELSPPPQQSGVMAVSKPIECISYFLQDSNNNRNDNDDDDEKAKEQEQEIKKRDSNSLWQRYRPEGELSVVTFVASPLKSTAPQGDGSTSLLAENSGAEIVVSDDVGRALVTIPLHAHLDFTVHEANFNGASSIFVEIANLNPPTAIQNTVEDSSRSVPQTQHVGLLLASSADGQLFTQWMQSHQKPPTEFPTRGAIRLPDSMESDFHAFTARQTPRRVMTASTAATSAPTQSAPPFLYCINYLKTKKSANIRRGASVKALALCSSHQHICCAFKSILRHTLDLYFDAPDDKIQQVLADLFRLINSVDLSNFPRPSPLKRKVWRWSIVDRKPLQFSTKLSFQGKDFEIVIPFGLEPEDEIGDERISVIKLVRKFKENTMVLFNSILTEKRVLFLGHNQSAGDVCFYVLSAAQLLCPPLRGLVQKGRIYPYASLVNLQFLNQVGYLAGVTNPMFEHREAWWDILCDLDTGKIKKNPNTWHSDDGAYAQHDQKFIANVISLINAHALKGVNPLYSEDVIRCHFNTYAREITDLGFENECVFLDEATKRDMLESNTTRLAHWKMTLAYRHFLREREHAAATRAVKDLDVERHVRTLQNSRNLSEGVILSILQDLVRQVRTEEQLLELLSFLPESLGGLYPLAVAMFHPSEAVRLAAVALFRRLDTIKEGSRCISLLNTFLMLTYERNSRLMPKTDHA